MWQFVHTLITPQLSNNIQHKLLWFIHLRWIIVLGFFCLPFFHIFVPEASLPSLWPLILVTLLLGVPNGFLHAQYRKYCLGDHNGETLESQRYLVKNFILQVAIDYLGVTVLILNYGLSRIPLALLFLPHIIIASIIYFRKRSGFAVMLVAVGLIFILATLQHSGLIPIYPFYPDPIRLHSPFLFCTFYLIIFIFIFALSATLTNAVLQREMELIRMNEQLLLMDREKSLFTLKATHELKAPFTAIQSYIQVINSGALGELNPKIRDVFEKIRKRAEALSRKINNIIQLSNLRTSNFKKSEFESVALLPFLAEKVEPFEDRGAARDIRLVFETDFPPDYQMELIPALAEMLLDNLLSNAFNYTKDHTKVTLKVALVDSNHLLIRVRDEGIGIEAAFLNKIFEEHFRTERATKVNQYGNGLGLAIVKEIVSIHHGSIRVESEVEQWTEFFVTLPVSQAL
jgi:signal transduction histidine kinase